jgi:hypothetical protein
MKVLIAVCANPKTNPEILRRARACAAATGHDVLWHDAPAEGPTRLSKLAAARNAMADRIAWQEYDYVAQPDADVFYGPDTIAQLPLDRGRIVAPLVMIEGWADRFYDTAGFVAADGTGFRHRPPWLPGDHGDLVQCRWVGSFYVYPAWLLGRGCRWAEGVGRTEHGVFCRMAREQGVFSFCDFRVRAYHANLPEYGEAWH